MVSEKLENLRGSLEFLSKNDMRQMAFGHMMTLNSIKEDQNPFGGGESPRVGFEMFGNREKSTIDAADMVSVTSSINFDRNSHVFNKSPEHSFNKSPD